MNKLIFANLLHRPVRSIISVLAVAIEVVMILSIVGIFMGMLNDQKLRTNGIGADIMVMPSNASMFNGVGAVSLPQADADALLKSTSHRWSFAGNLPSEHQWQSRDSLRRRLCELQCPQAIHFC